MKIKAEQLATCLQQKLMPAYLIVGEEILLVDECLQMIRDATKRQQFDERHAFSIETGFDWGSFFAIANSLSLFSNRTLIELRFKNSPNAQALQALASYFKKPPEDKLLVILVPKLEKSALAHASIKTIEKIGVFIPLWPMTIAQLPIWIRNRLKKNGLEASDEAIQFMASQVEGNLLAAHQEIEKLSLLYPSLTKLTLEQVVEAVYDSARYNVFNLSDAILAGNLKQSLRILKSLQEEGTEPTLILWAIAREIRLLLSIAEEAAQNAHAVNALMGKYRVWEKHQPFVKAALRRLNRPSLARALQAAAKIDPIIKSNQSHSAWLAFSELISRLTQPGILPENA